MRTTGRARRGTPATTACRWRRRVVPRDAGHRGQRVLSRLSGRERVLVSCTVGARRGCCESETCSELRKRELAILGSNQYSRPGGDTRRDLRTDRLTCGFGWIYRVSCVDTSGHG